MIRQEQLAVVIDAQKLEFVSKDSELEREVLNDIPIIESYTTIITGIRRCGKSTILLQLLKKKKYKNAIYFNFEDIRLAGFDTSDFLRLHNEIKERDVKVIIFDEIQLVDKWEIYVHQLLREGYIIFITGSNASLLSKELGTNLTGRHVSMELFPFSYSEYVKFTKQKYDKDSLQGYLKTGGIPEFVKSNQSLILNNLIEDILIRDIAVRHSVKDVDSLRQLAVYLMSNVGNLISANKLVGMFGIKSSATILDFFSFFKDSYLIEMMPQFSFSIKAQARNPKKIYATDIGLVNATSTSFTDNEGHKLENLVYIYLRSKYKGIYYFKDKGECDFVVFEKEKAISAIQVCYKITNENFEREYNGLLQAMKVFDLKTGTIVTLNSKDIFEKEGLTVNVIPAHIYLSK